MANLKIYRPGYVDKLISKRTGETKFGEKISFIENAEELAGSDAKYVLFGIPEDIGVRANYGNSGTAKAWEACLQALLNTQANEFNKPENLLLLGEVNCSEEMEKAGNLGDSDPNYFPKLGDLVAKIDEEVSAVVKMIISSGKVPIIIGGGHNNAYGNLKGAAEAFGTSVNALNIDAHTDLRLLEHRHSGNGFSYAIENGFLRKYSVFGLHQNYTPQVIFEKMSATDELSFHLMEDLQSSNKSEELDQAIDFVGSAPFGLEVDCDVIAGFPSSAESPSGFTLDEVRGFVRMAANDHHCAYLHLCEAAPRVSFPTGKALSYLVTDFIKLHH